MQSSLIHNNVNLVEFIEQPTWKTILMELIKSTKTDPWDIDIGLLADYYIAKVNEMDSANLRVPANAILCSAILLKFKSKTLKISSIEEEEDEFDDWGSLTEEQRKEREKLFLKEGTPYLAPQRLMREGKVNLDDLVKSIEDILIQTKKKRLLEQERKPIEFAIPFAERNIEEKMQEVLNEIKTRIDSEGLVLFSQLTKSKKDVDIIHTFIPCLFLHNQGYLFIYQEDFFGEIFITFLNKEFEKQTEAAFL
ncbi:MAG TPA: segregation/condensation protein A [archaeon]|nr:segregation/condensation protein A [archaeon]